MKYEDLIKELFENIPTYLTVFNEQKEEKLLDEESGAHIIFGMLIVPYLFKLINNPCTNNDIIKKSFEFFEFMSKSNDVKVTEVLEFTILEQFVDKGKEQLDVFKQFMGENTLKSCEEIEKYFMVS